MCMRHILPFVLLIWEGGAWCPTKGPARMDTHKCLPSYLLQSRRGPPPLQGKYVECIHFYGGGGKSLFVHPSAVSLVCLPEQPTLGLSRTFGPISACVLLFIYMRGHTFSQLLPRKQINTIMQSIVFNCIWDTWILIAMIGKKFSRHMPQSRKRGPLHSHTSD